MGLEKGVLSLRGYVVFLHGVNRDRRRFCLLPDVSVRHGRVPVRLSALRSELGRALVSARSPRNCEWHTQLHHGSRGRRRGDFDWRAPHTRRLAVGIRHLRGSRATLVCLVLLLVSRSTGRAPIDQPSRDRVDSRRRRDRGRIGFGFSPRGGSLVGSCVQLCGVGAQHATAASWLRLRLSRDVVSEVSRRKPGSLGSRRTRPSRVHRPAGRCAGPSRRRDRLGLGVPSHEKSTGRPIRCRESEPHLLRRGLLLCAVR